MTGPRPGFGSMLAAMRARRRVSQLGLSLSADVSARHISFLETGRAAPSRVMVHKLARALKLGAGDCDALLNAAGFVAPAPAARMAAQATSAMRDQGPWSHGDWDVALAIETAQDRAGAAALAADALAALGLTHFFTGTLTPAGGSSPVAIAHDEIEHAPVGWILHYTRRGYLPDDPLVDAASRSHLAFFWSDVLTPAAMRTPRVRTMMGEAVEHGIRNGFVQPVRRADGRIHAISCMADLVQADAPRTRARARLIAVALLHRLDELGSSPGPRQAVLRGQAGEYLKHVLDGRSADWICGRFRQPLSEVEHALAATCIQFGTGEPVEAALRARRSGLI